MLVATDIAARGVHVDDVELVVHVDPPVEHKAYLHRSGRTARAGSAGDVVTVVLPEQRRDTAALLRQAGINVKPQEVAADSAPVQALVGEVAPYQAPAARPAPAAEQARIDSAPSAGRASWRSATRKPRRPRPSVLEHARARSRGWPACPAPIRRGGGPRCGLRVRDARRWRRSGRTAPGPSGPTAGSARRRWSGSTSNAHVAPTPSPASTFHTQRRTSPSSSTSTTSHSVSQVPNAS